MITRKKYAFIITLALYSCYIVSLLSSAPFRGEMMSGNPSAWMFLFSFLCGFGLISFIFVRRAADAAPNRIVRLSLLIILALGAFISLPLPGAKTYILAKPSNYEASIVRGNIEAPNVLERRAYMLDLFAGRAYRPHTQDVRNKVQAAPNTAEAQVEGEFADLLELPYEVPKQFYESAKPDASDPHGVMKLLAQWTRNSGIDSTQGQKVMGIGSVSTTGEISAIDQIEVYTKAAAQAAPDVFFVPVDAYQQVKDIAPDLLVVPVARFEEVLYFLEQPVEFWPLRNFGLYCH